MKKVYRAHPYMAFSFLKPYLFVLIIPLLYALLRFLRTGEKTSILFAEIVIFVALAALSLWRCAAFRLVLDGQTIFLRRGVFFRQDSVIPREKLTVARFRRGATHFVTGSTAVQLNTEAGTGERADFSFVMSRKGARDLEEALNGSPGNTAVRYSAWRVALMAASTSSMVSGVLIGVPLINNLGKLFGNGIARMLFDQVERLNVLEKYFPPIINSLTVLVLTFFLFGFLVIFFRYFRLSLMFGRSVHIRSGLFSRTHTVFRAERVNGIFSEQNFLMRLFGLYSLKAEIGGMRYQQGDTSALSPALNRRQRDQLTDRLFPTLKATDLTARPIPGQGNRFLFFPSLWFCLSGVVFSLCIWFFEQFWSGILLLSAAVALWIAFGASLGVWNYRNGGIGMNDTVLTAVNTVMGKGVCLCCKKEAIGMVRVVRNPVDRRSGTCSVKIGLRSKTGTRIKVRLLAEDRVRELFGLSE